MKESSSTPASAVVAARPLTYADACALKILAAERMGLKPSYVAEATSQLEGKPLHPMMGNALCRESTAIHHRFAIDEDAMRDGNEHVCKLMRDYGLYVRPALNDQQQRAALVHSDE